MSANSQPQRKRQRDASGAGPDRDRGRHRPSLPPRKLGPVRPIHEAQPYPVLTPPFGVPRMDDIDWDD